MLNALLNADFIAFRGTKVHHALQSASPDFADVLQNNNNQAPF
jgi:hypothetical protein